jgi:hypothetical protein
MEQKGCKNLQKGWDRVSKDWSISNDNTNITNITFHDLIIKIVQNLFIHNSYISHIDITITNTFDTQIYKKMGNSYNIYSFIGSTSFVNIFICVSNVFSMYDTHV